MASSKSDSKKEKLKQALQGLSIIDLPELDRIRAAVGDVSEGYLRKVLKESGVPLAPLVEGVNQSDFDSLERTLIALSKEYESNKHAARRIVITAKDHAKFAFRRTQNPDKEEMVLWMLTWLDDPAMFPLWIPLRRKQRGIQAESDQQVVTTSNEGDSLRDLLQGLHDGDFSRLEPQFVGGATIPKLIEYHRSGQLAKKPEAVNEALTCASFLGATQVMEYLLAQGVDPSGGSATGLNALQWAANRGQLEAVRLLIRRGAPLEERSMYDATALETAVWSAIHEPRGDQLQIIRELLDAGACLSAVDYPTGHAEVDSILGPEILRRSRQ